MTRTNANLKAAFLKKYPNGDIWKNGSKFSVCYNVGGKVYNYSANYDGIAVRLGLDISFTELSIDPTKDPEYKKSLWACAECGANKESLFSACSCGSLKAT
jgi:hypothetical protein